MDLEFHGWCGSLVDGRDLLFCLQTFKLPYQQLGFLWEIGANKSLIPSKSLRNSRAMARHYPFSQTLPAGMDVLV